MTSTVEMLVESGAEWQSNRTMTSLGAWRMPAFSWAEMDAAGRESRRTLGAEDEFPTSAEPIDEFDGARSLDGFLQVVSVDQDVGIDQRPRHVRRPRS